MAKRSGILGSVVATGALVLALPAAAQTVTVPTGTTQTNSAVIGDGSSANTLTVTGGGTLDLTSGANTYSGGTVVTGNSSLQVNSDTDLGNASSTLTLGTGSSSGTLDVTPSPVANGPVTSTRPITLGGTGGTIIASPEIWTFEGVISGSGGLTVTSPSSPQGAIALTGTNTYTGGTNVIGGANLEITTDSNLGASSGALTLGNATTNGELSLLNTAPVTSTRSVVLGAGGGTINSAAFPTLGYPTYAWTFTSPITGSGGLTIEGPGTIVLDGANTYSGGTTVTSGDLELGDAASPGASLSSDVTLSGGTFSGRGTVFGTLNNTGGTVNPGAGGVGNLTVSNYVQSSSGTLAISLTPGGVSELFVNGNANLSGALTFNALGALHAGTYQFLSAGSITGNFTQLPGLISVGFAQSLSSNANGTGYGLTLTQQTSIPENPSIYPALANTALNDAQEGTDNILSHLSDARSAGMLDHMVVATVSDHPTDDCSGCSPFGAWAKPLGNFGATNGSSSSPGYDAYGVGFIAGIDTPVSDDGDSARWVGGIAIAYNRDWVAESGGANGSISTPRVYTYASWWSGPYAVDGTLGFGYSTFDSSRPVAQTGSSATATTGGVEVTSSVQGSRVFEVKSFVLTPAAGFEFAHQTERAFSESGAGAYNLDGLATSDNSLRPFVAATLAKRFNVGLVTRIEPQIRVAYAVETLNNPGISVDPTADAYTFHYNGVTPSRGRASINAGLTVETSHDLNFFTDAGLVEAGNNHAAQLDAGVRCRF